MLLPYRGSSLPDSRMDYATPEERKKETMNKTYIRSRLRDAGRAMNRMIERANYEAREQLQAENGTLQQIEREINVYTEKLAPLRRAEEKIKKKIRAEVSARHLRAKRILDESFSFASEKMNTAITEPELIEARDAALVFIKQWETFEASILLTLKGLPTDGGFLVRPKDAKRLMKRLQSRQGGKKRR